MKIFNKKELKAQGCSDFFSGVGYTGFLFGEKTITIRENGELFDLIIFESWKEENWLGIDLFDVRRLLETELGITKAR